MERNNYDSKALIKNMPTAFAHHKVIFDEKGNPTDYIFLDINNKFEEFTGLKKEEIINKKATEVLDNITDSPFDWIKFYGNIALNGGSKSFERYSKPLDSWYQVQAYSQKKGYFTTLFNDITEKVNQRKDLEMMNFTLNNSDLLIFRTTPEGITDYVNQTVLEKLGYKKEEIIGKNAKMFLKTDRYIDREEFWKQIKKSTSMTYERKYITKTGDEFPVEITSQYFKYGNKEYEFAFAKDITERKKAKEKMKANKDKYETIFNSSPVGIILEDKKGNIIEANDMMTKMSGYSKEELEGSNVFDKFVLPEKKEEAKENIKKIIENDEEIKYETKTKIKNGKIKRYQLNETSISLPNGEKGLVSMQLDITERKNKEKRIKYLSYRDTLTDLYNRRYFEEEMNRLDTKRQLPISIIMADVNGLKIINDTYGHNTGDKLLVKTAEILKNSLRKEDILARWAGDEFVILLPQTTKEKAEKIIKRIKNKNKELSEKNIPISIGMGVATKNTVRELIDKVLEKADDNMYQNKLSESRSASNKIVQNLINTLAAKSSETKEHALRMTNLAYELGEKLNLSNSEMNKLSLLATLHDIGKTTISEEILTKAEKLTDEEWEIMKEHPEKGYKIASASEEFALVAEEILSHHEHWDGNGYPRSLEGKDIPYLARIISIIDAYDVMTNERPYSKAISTEDALAEIKECAGSQFDPKIAKSFIKLKKKSKL